MIFSTVLLASLFSLISGCSNTANESCITVTMTDLYGDGWDGARLYVEFPDGSTGSDAPTCTENPIVREICTSSSGMFYLTAAIEEDRVPENYWEVLWTVETCGNSTNGTSSNQTTLYTGTFNTTMILSYDDNTLEWSLVYYENILPNTKECDACGDARACKDDDKPRPKRRRDDRKKKRGDDRKKRRGGDDKGSAGSDDKNTTRGSDDDKNTTRRLGAGDNLRVPRAANTRVTMYDQDADGWWLDNYLGSSWYLADSTRTQLFHTGTLCDGATGYCKMCVSDGSYTMRFTGDGSDGFTTWDFCGVTGTYGQELIFEVENGRCIPIAILNLANACGDQTITYTFESSLELCLSSAMLNMSDPAAVSTVTQTLIEVLGAESAMVIIDEDDKGPGRGISRPSPKKASKKDDDDDKKKRLLKRSDDDKNMTATDDHKSDDKNMTSTDDDKKSDDKNMTSTDDDKKSKKSTDDDKKSNGKKSKKSTDDDKKEMMIYQHMIKFQITFVVHSDQLVDMEMLEEQYTQLLADKIANGTFIPALIANSAIYGYDLLNTTSCAMSEEFELLSLVFDDSVPFVDSPLALDTAFVGSASHSTQVASYDYSSITLFSGALLLGFVAFVGILARGMNGYDTLGADSEHLDISTSAHSRHGLITGIEMDHSISNPLARNAAHEADMTRVSNAL
jgi:hypothetical protein